MIVNKEPALAIHVRLSQRDGRELLAMLDHLAAKNGGQSDCFALSSVAEKLSDACSVAFWLHENVDLDLPIGEALAVRQAIEANPNEMDQPSLLAASLASIWRRSIPCDRKAAM
jgi:hypothetical protein